MSGGDLDRHLIHLYTFLLKIFVPSFCLRPDNFLSGGSLD